MKEQVAEPVCEHEAIVFDSEEARGMTSHEVRERFPRWFGKCSCGYEGIYYASWEHFLAGDW